MNTPKTHGDAQQTGEQSDVVRSLVATKSLLAVAVTVGFHDGVRIVNSAVEQVVDIATDNRGPSEKAPVHRKAVWTESIDHNSWENAEGEAICKAAQAGHNPEIVWIFEAGRAKLVDCEDESRNDHAPKARVTEALNDNVGADP